MVARLCVIGFFVLLGIIFLFNKGMFLISGYWMLTKEQKERINTKALTKFMSFLMFAVALSIGLLVLDKIYPENYFEYMGFTLLAIILIIGTINGNLKRFRR
jgi:hypothetical protein